MTDPIQLEDHLPQLIAFLRKTANAYQSGKFNGWTDFRSHCDVFYTPTIMDSLEAVVPGWRKMASYANQQTIIHVTSVLISLLLLEEYRDATPEHKL